MPTGKLKLNDLGRIVANERNRRGMSLREAAAVTGIPFNTLARVEKGHVPDLPKFQAARRVEWCQYQPVFRITGEDCGYHGSDR